MYGLICRVCKYRSRILNSAEIRPINADFIAVVMDPGTNTRFIHGAPLLSEEILPPPLLPDHLRRSSPMISARELILNRGGYWIKCTNVNPQWTKDNFDALIKHTGIKSAYTVERLPDDRAYIQFPTDGEAYKKFLKCVGWLDQAPISGWQRMADITPKLDPSILCGMTVRPCAEANYAYDILGLRKKFPFNNPTNDRASLPSFNKPKWSNFKKPNWEKIKADQPRFIGKSIGRGGYRHSFRPPRRRPVFRFVSSSADDANYRNKVIRK